MQDKDRPTVSSLLQQDNKTTKKPIFSHPTPLKILLYTKSKDNNTVGVREVQRKLEINTISTVSWHLNKLIEDGYLRKTPTNKYELTALGRDVNEIDVSVAIPVNMFRGKVLPRSFFSFGIILAATILYIILMYNTRNPFTVQVYGLVILVIVLLTNLIQLLTFRRRLADFLDY